MVVEDMLGLLGDRYDLFVIVAWLELGRRRRTVAVQVVGRLWRYVFHECFVLYVR